MDTVEHTPLSQSVLGASVPWPHIALARISLPAPRKLAFAVFAAVVFLATVLVAARDEHALYLHPDFSTQAIRAVVPLGAGAVAAYAIFRPWRAFLAVLLLTPCWNAAQVSWQVGPLQVILQTVFVGVLAVGCFRARRPRAADVAEQTISVERGLDGRTYSGVAAVARWAAGFEAYRFAEVAALGLLGIAVLSTLASPNVTLSSTVLLHGILEPVALGAILVALRPTRRDLVTLAIVLGSSAALGALLNVLQALPSMTSFGAIQAQRLVFARVTYFNVGLYGVILAMVVPLVVGILACRRSLRLRPWATRMLVAVLATCLVGLFLTLSKSAYLATALGSVLLLVLLVSSWQRRAAIVLTAAVLSSAVIPWPALVLQIAPAIDSAYRTAAVAVVGASRFDSWNPATLAGHGSLAERFYAVEGAVHISQDHPLLGIGLDQFGRYYVLLGYRPAAAKDNFDHAHSLFPEIAAELGLLAMVLVVVIYASCLWALWRIYRAPPDRTTRALAAALFASLVGWLIAATAFGCDIYRPDRDLSSDVVTMAVIVAASIALARISSARRGSSPLGPPIA